MFKQVEDNDISITRNQNTILSQSGAFMSYNQTKFITTKSKPLSVCLAWLILPIYFTIKLIFATIHGTAALFGTIHGSYCTIWANFYLYLSCFQQKKKKIVLAK